MVSTRYHIFISYRREDGKDTARLLKESLVQKGYRVFLDMDELQDGVFDERILEAIDAAPIYMLIMTKHCFDRCHNADDWVRQEIEYAIKQGKTIIPINPDKQFVDYPETMPKHLREALKVHQYSAIDTEQLYQESINKLIQQRIRPALRPRVDLKQIGIVLALCLCILTALCYFYMRTKVSSDDVQPKDQSILLNENDECHQDSSLVYVQQQDQSIPLNENDLRRQDSSLVYVQLGDQCMQPDENYLYDHDSALIYYNKALQLGNIAAYARIAWVYESLGQETNRLTTFDWVAYEDTAVYYYQRGAYAGDPVAQVELAYKLTAQGTSILTEPDTAFYWATQAYNAGYKEAPAALGYLYRNGFGVKQDSKKAEMYFREAIAWGDSKARVALGVMMRNGEGIPQNYVEGTRLLIEAMQENDPNAVFALKGLATWVDAPQIEQQTESNVSLLAFEWDKQGVLRVYFQWHNKQYPNGWMQIDSSAYIYDIQSDTRYTVSDVINCTFSPEYTAVPLGTKHQFGLVFDGVPESISCVNICESDTSQWKFFGVHLEEKTHIVTLEEYFFKDVLDDL